MPESEKGALTSRPFDEALHESIAKNQKNIRGVAAYRGGELCRLDAWGGFTANDTVHVMSVTKSVVSLLIGIAVDRGLIKSVNERVLSFFPDYQPKRGETTLKDVTIEHLLTMTAPYKYRSEPWTKICTSENWTTATLDILGGRAGLTDTFRYSTLGIHVLTGVLARVTGQSTVDFANEALFAPLGIASRKGYLAKTAEEHREFILSKAPKGNIWFSDPQGVGAAGYGLCLSAVEMARIGRLCLGGGELDGRRVVSEKWLVESAQPHRQCGEDFGNMGYGYLWWTPDMHKPAFAALGNSGNAIYVDRQRDVTVAVSGVFQPNIFDRVAFIEREILPLL